MKTLNHIKNLKGPYDSTICEQLQPVSTTGDVNDHCSLTLSPPSTPPQPHQQLHTINMDDIAVLMDVGLDCGSHRGTYVEIMTTFKLEVHRVHGPSKCVLPSASTSSISVHLQRRDTTVHPLRLTFHIE
eukprot:2461835-Amphidinium_carterae.1